VRTAVFLFFFFIISIFVRSSYGSAFLPLKFTAKFTQEYKSVVTGKIKKGNGHFDYQFPGMLRFEMSHPTPLVFITRANQNWYYRPPYIEGERGEVKKDVPGGQTISRFFDALSEGLENNNFYNVKRLGQKKVEINFTKNSAQELGIRNASLVFAGKKHMFTNLKQIDLNYLDGKENKIKFNKITLVDEFSRLNFTFKENNPPKIRSNK
jgi:outer membrane lipoprotein-sorting protein